MERITYFNVSNLVKQVTQSQKEVEQLCQPIFHFFGLKYFELYRVYPDNSFIILTSHPMWIEHYFSNNYFETTDTDCHNRLKQFDFILWNDWPQEDKAVWHITKEAEQFQLTDTITLIFKFPDALNVFSFGAPLDTGSIRGRYLMDMSVLEKFSYYFLAKSQRLINQANKIKSKLPIMHDKFKREDTNEKIQILDTLEITKLYFTVNHEDVFLSKQETKVAIHYVQGVSAKQMANRLDITHKTIEWHIENIKRKLQCFSKDQLRDELSRNPMIAYMLKSIGSM